MIIVRFMFVNGIMESNQLDIISIDNPEKTPDFSLLTAKVLDQKESETMGLFSISILLFLYALNVKR